MMFRVRRVNIELSINFGVFFGCVNLTQTPIKLMVKC